jgi:hypothetical protein
MSPFIAATVPLLSRVEYRPVISDNCWKFIQKISVPDVYLLNGQNVFYIAGLLTEATQMNDIGKSFVETVLFSLNYEVKNSFHDRQGTITIIVHYHQDRQLQVVNRQLHSSLDSGLPKMYQIVHSHVHYHSKLIQFCFSTLANVQMHHHNHKSHELQVSYGIR